jgi:hypothetical protein
MKHNIIMRNEEEKKKASNYRILGCIWLVETFALQLWWPIKVGYVLSKIIDCDKRQKILTPDQIHMIGCEQWFFKIYVFTTLREGKNENTEDEWED